MSLAQANLEDAGCVTRNYPFKDCEEAEKYQQHIEEDFRLEISKLFMQHKIREIRRRVWNKIAEEPMNRWCSVCSALLIDTLNMLNHRKVLE